MLHIQSAVGMKLTGTQQLLRLATESHAHYCALRLRATPAPYATCLHYANHDSRIINNLAWVTNGP